MQGAAAQSKLLGQIEPLLTEEEAEIVRRGRNAHAQHAAPKHADPAEDSRRIADEVGETGIAGDRRSALLPFGYGVGPGLAHLGT